MSVPFILSLIDLEEAKSKLSQDDYWDLLDEDYFIGEPIPTDELSYQQWIVEVYKNFKSSLSLPTQNKMNSLLNVIFWTCCEEEGVSTIEGELSIDGLELSLSPQTCNTLHSTYLEIDFHEIKSNFQATEIYPLEFCEFKEYLDAWFAAISKAAKENKYLISVVAI